MDDKKMYSPKDANEIYHSADLNDWLASLDTIIKWTSKSRFEKVSEVLAKKEGFNKI